MLNNGTDHVGPEKMAADPPLVPSLMLKVPTEQQNNSSREANMHCPGQDHLRVAKAFARSTTKVTASSSTSSTLSVYVSISVKSALGAPPTSHATGLLFRSCTTGSRSQSHQRITESEWACGLPLVIFLENEKRTLLACNDQRPQKTQKRFASFSAQVQRYF